MPMAKKKPIAAIAFHAAICVRRCQTMLLSSFAGNDTNILFDVNSSYYNFSLIISYTMYMSAL